MIVTTRTASKNQSGDAKHYADMLCCATFNSGHLEVVIDPRLFLGNLCRKSFVLFPKGTALITAMQGAVAINVYAEFGWMLAAKPSLATIFAALFIPGLDHEQVSICRSHNGWHVGRRRYRSGRLSITIDCNKTDNGKEPKRRSRSDHAHMPCWWTLLLMSPSQTNQCNHSIDR